MAETVQRAVLLAAGTGERCWPNSTIRNKCASPISGVANVRRLVNSLAERGVRRVAVVVGHQAGSVRTALAGASAEIAFVDQTEPGTAGAVLAAAQAIDDDRFLVIYGDTVTTTENLRHFIEQYEASGMPGAAMWDPMPRGEGSLWYAAHVEHGRLREVVGHEEGAERRLCGVFAVDRSILPALEASSGYMRVPIGGMPPNEPDFAQGLNDWGQAIAAIEARDWVVDMDKPWHLLEANRLVARRLCGALTESEIDPTAKVHDGAEIRGPIRLGPGAEIGNRVVIEGPAIIGANTRVVNGAILRGNNVIGERTRISDYCLLDEATVVGNDCVVGHGAEMDGVMMDGSYLWHYCEISGVVGQSVDIGAATVCGTLRFDDGPAEHNIRGRRERPISGANATYFGDFSRTGVNVITMPGAKIGCYSCIGGGIVVTGDVPDRTLRILKQETVDRPWGPERYGW